MAIDYENCEAYFIGEIRPLIFEVYTESGIPFTLTNDQDTPNAFCTVSDENGNLKETLVATIISDESSSKKFLCSWNTNQYSVGYYRLQVWALINISGAEDESGNFIVEAKLASEEIIRYLKT